MKDALVTVAIPSIKIRSRQYLSRALASVFSQTHQPTRYEVAIDRTHDGAATTRNRALSKVETPWVAFLDDDDHFLPHHIEKLLATAEATGADIVYPGCRVIGPDMKEIPRQEDWGRFGEPFNGDLLMKKSYIPVTSLVRTSVAQRAWFGPPAHEPDSLYDDWGFYTRCFKNGAKFVHLPEVTWVWDHHGRNTSGQGDRW